MIQRIYSFGSYLWLLWALHRTYALSVVSLHPDWIPLVSTSSAENQIIFHLQLMTGRIVLTLLYLFNINGIKIWTILTASCFHRKLGFQEGVLLLFSGRSSLFWSLRRHRSPLSSARLRGPLCRHCNSRCWGSSKIWLYWAFWVSALSEFLKHGRGYWVNLRLTCNILSRADVSRTLTWQTPAPTFYQEPKRTSWGFSWMPSGSTESPTIRCALLASLVCCCCLKYKPPF